MPDDTAAVQRALQGDEDAARELYERHVDFVFSLVRPRVAGRERALEAVQEVFVKASRRLHDLEPGDDLRDWLAAIVRAEVPPAPPDSGDEGARSPETPAPPDSGDEGASLPAPSAPPAARGEGARPLTGPERAYIYEAARRRRSLDPWRPLWKLVLAVAVLLMALGLWFLQRTLAGP